MRHVGLTIVLLLVSSPFVWGKEIGSSPNVSSVVKLSELSLLQAVNTAVLHNPQLKIGEVGVDVASEQIEVQEGAFDVAVVAQGSASTAENPLSIGTDIAGINNDAQTLNAGLRRMFRSGATLDFQVSTSGSGDEFQGATANETAMSTAALTITYPLWRGRGEYMTTARLEVSKLEFESATFELGHRTDQSILATLNSYWGYRGAYDSLRLLIEAERRSKDLFDEIEKLIRADEIPKSELSTIQAQVSQRSGSRLNGEIQLIQSRTALANNLGVILDSDLTTNRPVTELPEPHLDESLLLQLTGRAVLPYVRANRKDFVAIGRRIEVADRIAEVSTDGTRPSLNLVVGGQYQKFEQNDDLFKSLSASTFGPGWSVRLEYDWTINQTAAKANERIAMLGSYRRKVERDELVRAAEIDFDTALFSLSRAYRGNLEATSRLQLSQAIVENEQRKFYLGEATLLDVLNVGDRLLEAEIDQISKRVNYSTALSNMMFLSGYLSRIGSAAITERQLKQASLMIEELGQAKAGSP